MTYGLKFINERRSEKQTSDLKCDVGGNGFYVNFDTSFVVFISRGFYITQTKLVSSLDFTSQNKENLCECAKPASVLRSFNFDFIVFSSQRSPDS